MKSSALKNNLLFLKYRNNKRFFLHLKSVRTTDIKNWHSSAYLSHALDNRQPDVECVKGVAASEIEHIRSPIFLFEYLLQLYSAPYGTETFLSFESDMQFLSDIL